MSSPCGDSRIVVDGHHWSDDFVPELEELKQKIPRLLQRQMDLEVRHGFGARLPGLKDGAKHHLTSSLLRFNPDRRPNFEPGSGHKDNTELSRSKDGEHIFEKSLGFASFNGFIGLAYHTMRDVAPVYRKLTTTQALMRMGRPGLVWAAAGMAFGCGQGLNAYFVTGRESYWNTTAGTALFSTTMLSYYNRTSLQPAAVAWVGLWFLVNQYMHYRKRWVRHDEDVMPDLIYKRNFVGYRMGPYKPYKLPHPGEQIAYDFTPQYFQPVRY